MNDGGRPKAYTGLRENGVSTRQNGLGPIERLRADGHSCVAARRFHFVGAGGVGMSGLAKILLKNRAIVTGSDKQPSKTVLSLRSLGMDIRIGHSPGNIPQQTEAVVTSAAIRPDNPELMAAHQRGVKVYKYAQLLGSIMNSYQGIAISGTHGKTTTSGWLSFCLLRAGVDVNYIVGAEIADLHCSSGSADSEYFIAEACEYDRSFLNIRPKVACILNIEADHLDYYSNLDEIIEAFCAFAGGVKPAGVVVANGRDKNVAAVLRRLGKNIRVKTFGIEKGCDFYAEKVRFAQGKYSFDICYKGKLLGKAESRLPGLHNVVNALAAAAAGVSAGFQPGQILPQLGLFKGIDRRLMLKGRAGGITVVDDYAHHPSEIRASLEAIRQAYQPGRLYCVFQPHQYSRTRFLLDDFAESFKLADVTVVPDIYFVRDSELSSSVVNAEILVQRIRQRGSQALFIKDFGDICDFLKADVNSGELVVTMGAGDVFKVADEYIRWLRANS